jgi:hypothetical protein
VGECSQQIRKTGVVTSTKVDKCLSTIRKGRLSEKTMGGLAHSC